MSEQKQVSPYHHPKTVYVIRDRKGNFAARTKIYPSKSGAKNGLNWFVDALLQNHTRYDIWYMYNSKRTEKLTLADFNNGQVNQSRPVSQAEIDQFYQFQEDLYKKWQIEEIAQNYE